MSSMYAFRSVLKDHPPSPGPSLGGRLSRRVVIVLVDALRLDTSLNNDVMPNLNELRRQGATAHMHSRPPSYSQPGYTVILTGAWPDINDGPPINLPYDEIPTFTQDDIFSAAKRAGIGTAVSGYYWFEKLIPQMVIDQSFYTPGEDRVADRQVVDAAIMYLKEGKAGLILVHIDQVDYAGHHEGGPGDVRWDLAAKRVDDLIGEITGSMDLSQDTLLVISDHGQIDGGGHGGHEAITLLEPFVLVGAGVTPGDYRDLDMVDVAPTIAVLLGTNLPASNQGVPQVQMLKLEKRQMSAVKLALQNQQSALLEAFQNGLGVREDLPGDMSGNPIAAMQALRQDRLAGERERRLQPVLLLVLLPALYLNFHRGRALGWLFLGAGIITGVFHLYYAVIEQKTYSLSSVTGVEDLFGTVAGGIILGFLVSWPIIAAGLEIFRLSPGAAFEKIIHLTLLAVGISALSVIASYYLNGFVVSWTLPEFGSATLSFLALLQIAIMAIFGLLLAVITSIIVWTYGRIMVHRER